MKKAKFGGSGQEPPFVCGGIMPEMSAGIMYPCKVPAKVGR